jgi:hypothetical protein
VRFDQAAQTLAGSSIAQHSHIGMHSETIEVAIDIGHGESGRFWFFILLDFSMTYRSQRRHQSR